MIDAALHATQVQSYELSGYSVGKVVPLSSERQQLRDATITSSNGGITMSFTATLGTAGIPLDLNAEGKGSTDLLWAHGSSPLAAYKVMVKLYKEGKITFEHVITFNMDE